MKQARTKRSVRIKAAAIAIAALAGGIGLLILSQMVFASAEKAAAEAAAAAATQPATAPAETDRPAGQDTATPPLDPKAASARNMGGLLLLFSLMCFALVVICVGWIVYDVRRSRPAWMRQTKHPVHQRRK